MVVASFGGGVVRLGVGVLKVVQAMVAKNAAGKLVRCCDAEVCLVFTVVCLLWMVLLFVPYERSSGRDGGDKKHGGRAYGLDSIR